MALVGISNEEKIWNYLKDKGLNDFGCAGLMGNLQAESGLRPNNLQNTYEKKLGYTDDEYVAAVDSGKYINFAKDKAGFGLAQWTYWSRKQKLLEHAQASKQSIGDLEMQLDFLWSELTKSYKAVVSMLKKATSVREASDAVLLKYEKPANQGTSVQEKRESYGQAFYNKYAGVETTEANNKNESLPFRAAVKAKVGSATVTAGQPTTSATVSTYKPRVAAPATSDRHWIHTSKGGLNSCILISGNSCLPNCVGYAWGRWYELLGSEPKLSRANAENWYAFTADGYKRSSTPELGAVICWRKGQAGNGSDGAGHVAIVEDIKSNGDIITSNSAYGGTRFYMQTLTKTSGYRIGSGYTFQGFILLPKKLSTTTPSVPASASSDIKAGDVVQIASNAVYYSGKAVPAWVKNKSWIVSEVSGNRAVIDKSQDGKNAINSPIGTQHLVLSGTSTNQPSLSEPYLVKVTASALNIRKGPGTTYGTAGTIKDKGVYTIIEEASGAGATKWGLLKSKAGWISLDYCKKM